jgi:hypothetical protein
MAEINPNPNPSPTSPPAGGPSGPGPQGPKGGEAKPTDTKRIDGPNLGSEPFRHDPSLDAWVSACIAEPALWGALQRAVAACVLEARPGATSGIVLAEHPLIGLATIAALGGDIRVPVRSLDERPRSAGGLKDALRPETTNLGRWQALLQGIEHAGRSFVMRAWDMRDVDLRAISRDLGQPDASGPRIICLVQGPRKYEDTDPVLADTCGRTRDILVKVIEDLDLPREILPSERKAARVLIDALQQEFQISPDQILRSLNSTEHAEFEKLAWEPHLKEGDGKKLLDDWIRPVSEDKPRHTASLFVAAHFPPLPPDTFIELADMLAARTPCHSPGRNDSQPPEEVTDRVLDDCNIRFIQRLRQKRVYIGSPQGDRPTGERAALVKHLFDRHAPLLVERYLYTLALRLTLGHASDDIVGDYQEMEIKALRRLNRDQASERLRRIVFGYAAVGSLEHGFKGANQRSLEAKLLRAVRRVPGFLDLLLQRGPADAVSPDGDAATLSLSDAVSALCTVRPLDDEWEGEFHAAVARLFWYAYAANPGEVTLAACPPVFDQGDSMDEDERRERRQALLHRLQDCLDLQTGGDRSDVWTKRLHEPQTVTHLVSDVARQLPGMVSSDTDSFGASLLGEAACQYLIRVIRHSPWRGVPVWPQGRAADHSPARGITSQRFKRWLTPDERYGDLVLQSSRPLRRGTLQPTTVPSKLPAFSAAAGPDLVAEGYRTWLLALGALDGLVGIAAFGDDLEGNVATAVMFDSNLGTGQVGWQLQVAVERGIFNYRVLWEWLCDPSVHDIHDLLADGEPQSEDELKGWASMLAQFRLTVPHLWEAIPVLLLMAATRVPDRDPVEFELSPAMRRFLVGEPGTAGSASAAGRAPVLALLATIERLQKLQRAFREALDKWRVPFREREVWHLALRDREAALSSFRRTLDPLRRDAHQGITRPDDNKGKS